MAAARLVSAISISKFVSAVELGSAERIHFPRKDGTSVEGWIVLPRTTAQPIFHARKKASSMGPRALSPITHALHVKTPSLFVHGEADMRVPIEQAEQIYRALQKQHVPSKFIRYPENSHGGWPPWDIFHRYYNEVLGFDQ